MLNCFDCTAVTARETKPTDATQERCDRCECRASIYCIYGHGVGHGGAVEQRAAKGNSASLRCAALLMYSSRGRRGMNAGMLDRRANAW
jgi:hypothetical protein